MCRNSPYALGDTKPDGFLTGSSVVSQDANERDFLPISCHVFFHEYLWNPLLLVLFRAVLLKCITRHFLPKRCLAQPFINSHFSLYRNDPSNLYFVQNVTCKRVVFVYYRTGPVCQRTTAKNVHLYLFVCLYHRLLVKLISLVNGVQ